MYGSPNQVSHIFGVNRMYDFDLAKIKLRDVNSVLQKQPKAAESLKKWKIQNPNGAHAVAVGLNSSIHVEIEGSVGYYCAGMNEEAEVIIKGSAGPGVAENMMSGKVTVFGNASQYAGATGHGGILVIKGNASSRCGISMKGINIVVGGNVGHSSAFMAQAGNLLVLGNAGNGLGDSIYEANIFVAGSVGELGADCIEKEMREEHMELVEKLLHDSKITDRPKRFKRYGSARKLYHFDIKNVGLY